MAYKWGWSQPLTNWDDPPSGPKFPRSFGTFWAPVEEQLRSTATGATVRILGVAPACVACVAGSSESSPFGCWTKNGGKTPKMDGENHGKPLVKMGWYGGKTHHVWKHPFPTIIIKIPSKREGNIWNRNPEPNKSLYSPEILSNNLPTTILTVHHLVGRFLQVFSQPPYNRKSKFFTEPWLLGKLGGGFKHVFFSPRKLGTWSNFTHIFPLGWNHQLVFMYISYTACLDVPVELRIVRINFTYFTNFFGDPRILHAALRKIKMILYLTACKKKKQLHVFFSKYTKYSTLRSQLKLAIRHQLSSRFCCERLISTTTSIRWKTPLLIKRQLRPSPFWSS